MIDVLLVDEHNVVRAAIRSALENAGDFNVVGESAEGVEAIELARDLRPAVVLMELDMPGIGGAAVIDEVLRVSPSSRIVVLTAQDDHDAVVRALCAGAQGFVPKRATLVELMDAVRAVAGGTVYVAKDLSKNIFDYFQQQIAPAREARAPYGLTPRELQVLRLIAEGMTSKEIASVTRLSPETIRSYRKTLMQKLDVHNVAQLTQLAIRDRLVAPPAARQHTQQASEFAVTGK